MMIVAIGVSCVSSLPLGFLDESSQNWVYPLIGLQGVSIAIMLNTATALISDIIGGDSENSAFVYGCFSLFDKCANGLLVYFIVGFYSENIAALRILMATVPVLCSLFSFVFAFLGNSLYADRLTKISEQGSERELDHVGIN